METEDEIPATKRASGMRLRSQSSVLGERYWLTRSIAVGGMAEIFLAKYRGVHGFTKDVVIKRLRPELAGDSRVAAMFRDEARVTGMLNHAHTVHAFDSGTHNSLPYIAMEYFPGEELNVLCRRGSAQGNLLPAAHGVELMRQAALGMGYYHNLRDATGEKLGLVHCDISPDNLLVGESGYLQIIDFGVSRFRGQECQDNRVVPGKVSYMSPEQAARQPLDYRVDIFALGIILYELTVGRRLFRGHPSEVLPRLLACDIPAPTSVCSGYPANLESIVMRALEKHPDARYQNAYDFADALGTYLREEHLDSGPVGVARYLSQLTDAVHQSRLARGSNSGYQGERTNSPGEMLIAEEPADSNRVQGGLVTPTKAAGAASRWTKTSMSGTTSPAQDVAGPRMSNREAPTLETAESDRGGVAARPSNGGLSDGVKPSLFRILILMLSMGIGFGVSCALLVGVLA